MTLDDIKRALLASYDTDGGINHLDGTNRPSEESVNRLAVDFMHLLFPGFFDQRPLVKEEVPALTERRLADIAIEGDDEALKAEFLSGVRHAWAKAVPEAPLPRVLRMGEDDVDSVLSAYLGLSMPFCSCKYCGKPIQSSSSCFTPGVFLSVPSHCEAGALLIFASSTAFATAE